MRQWEARVGWKIVGIGSLGGVVWRAVIAEESEEERRFLL